MSALVYTHNWELLITQAGFRLAALLASPNQQTNRAVSKIWQCFFLTINQCIIKSMLWREKLWAIQHDVMFCGLIQHDVTFCGLIQHYVVYVWGRERWGRACAAAIKPDSRSSAAFPFPNAQERRFFHRAAPSRHLHRWEHAVKKQALKHVCGKWLWKPFKEIQTRLSWRAKRWVSYWNFLGKFQ